MLFFFSKLFYIELTLNTNATDAITNSKDFLIFLCV